MHWIIERPDGDVRGALVCVLRAVLAGGMVEALLVPLRHPAGDALAPALVKDPALLDLADPLAPVLPLNGARLVSMLTQRPPRPRIAAVFENRLRIGMKLDCDPTTIYAALLQQRYNGVIHRSDLDSDHPYNTYRHAGLPPGAIANPGLASMRAVLTPSDSDSLYFVARADGSGGHEFSSNIAAHESAVERYHRALGK